MTEFVLGLAEPIGVIPAQAGIQCAQRKINNWIQALAGMMKSNG
jgi:hypothetical protein